MKFRLLLIRSKMKEERTMCKWIIQKFILRELNKVLERYASDIDSNKFGATDGSIVFDL
jgi:glutathione peroxidase-family protein